MDIFVDTEGGCYHIGRYWSTLLLGIYILYVRAYIVVRYKKRWRTRGTIRVYAYAYKKIEGKINQLKAYCLSIAYFIGLDL